MKNIIAIYIKPYFARMAFGLSIKFTGTIMDLFIPYILAYIIDFIIPTREKKQIVLWGLVMVICAVIAVMFNVIANRKAAWVSSRVTEKLRHDLFEKIMNLSNRQMDAFTKPSLISRMTSDTYQVQQTVSRIQRLGVRAPILMIGGMIMTFTLDIAMAMVLLILIPLLLFLVILVSKKGIPVYKEVQEASDQMVRIVREDIAGIRVIKALSKTDYEKKKFSDVNHTVIEREKKAGMIMAVTSPIMNVLLNMGLVVVIIVGAFRVNTGTTEVGKILAFMTYFTIILNATLSLTRMFTMTSKAIASGERIWHVLSSKDDMDVILSEICPEEEPMISFENVTFSYYKNQKPSVKNISFQIKKGETLGIIGEIGSGKSTILSLLMRLYDVDSGKILIEGRDVRSYQAEELKKKFGVVFQNDMIFEDTIEENVTLGREISRQEVQEALLYARASEFVEKRQEKEEDALNIRGANLSGGQKQRVLIARALAKKPQILILDDSSSALDYKTDAALRQGIKEHYEDTTVVIVAQRISSIMHAEHILVLEDGEMIGYGTHEELMKNCEVYQEISHSQMGWKEEER